MAFRTPGLLRAGSVRPVRVPALGFSDPTNFFYSPAVPCFPRSAWRPRCQQGGSSALGCLSPRSRTRPTLKENHPDRDFLCLRQTSKGVIAVDIVGAASQPRFRGRIGGTDWGQILRACCPKALARARMVAVRDLRKHEEAFGQHALDI